MLLKGSYPWSILIRVILYGSITLTVKESYPSLSIHKSSFYHTTFVKVMLASIFPHMAPTDDAQIVPLRWLHELT